MPSHQQNLDALGRDVTLGDVLELLESIKDRHEIAGISSDGRFVDGYGDSPFSVAPLQWNLRLPLSGQTPETVAYLANLLK